MTKWGISALGLGIACIWLASPTQDVAGQSITSGTPVYGASGFWAAPLISDRCKDTERCAEWHDDTDGENGPKTLCCVATSRLRRNSYQDCRISFRTGGRDG